MAIIDAHDFAIVASDLHRVYDTRVGWFGPRCRVVAVEEVSFAVPVGTIFGLLGPNGAGKTTTIKMLSTLLTPTRGTATISGYDVARQDRMARRQLGVVLGGDRGLYPKLTARDNLRYFGRLYGMTNACLARRAEAMLEMVDLRDRADERVEGYSRGMKQRLHLAKALLHDPPILILDEPTIGLDPAAALDLRRALAELVPRHTVLLTTHDMHEADQLCREIAIVDEGRVVARGTPATLKAQMGGARHVVIATSAELDGRSNEVEAGLAELAAVHNVSRATTEPGETAWMLSTEQPAAALDAALTLLRARDYLVRRVVMSEPTLEDAFLRLTGRRLA